jgi:Surface-adhesin protein E
MRRLGGALPLIMVLALVGAAPAFASHWIQVGSNGGPDNKIMVDSDSLRQLGEFTLFDIMTVYPTPLVNSHDIELDRYIQRTAIDCAKRTFVAVKTTGYLNGKPVGTSRELRDWRLLTIPLPNDPASNRIYDAVCRPLPPKAG